MSSTNKTPNFNLPQFVETDTPTWLGDINDAFEVIDNNMGKGGSEFNESNEWHIKLYKNNYFELYRRLEVTKPITTAAGNLYVSSGEVTFIPSNFYDGGTYNKRIYYGEVVAYSQNSSDNVWAIVNSINTTSIAWTLLSPLSITNKGYTISIKIFGKLIPW